MNLPEEAMARLRARVREARQQCGLTIEKAAEKAGVTRAEWQYFEWVRKTAPTVPELRRYLKVVGLPPDETLKEVGLL